MSNTKSRGWCFTINNFTEGDINLCAILKDIAEYVVWGEEIGEQGTPHLQGFVLFKHPQHLKRLKTLLPRAHLEQQRGTAAQAADYCKKDGDFTEYGEYPATKKSLSDQYRECISLAESGQLDTIKELYPGIYLRYLSTFRSMVVRCGDILDELQSEWWVGPTGTGKSRTLWELYPDHYGKALNKWWDGYNGEETVAIEELNPESAKYLGHFIKIWGDRYPFSAEIKGGTLRRIRPKRIIVLSNYSIDECFPMSQDSDPIKRRFHVKHFYPFFNELNELSE